MGVSTGPLAYRLDECDSRLSQVLFLYLVSHSFLLGWDGQWLAIKGFVAKVLNRPEEYCAGTLWSIDRLIDSWGSNDWWRFGLKIYDINAMASLLGDLLRAPALFPFAPLRAFFFSFTAPCGCFSIFSPSLSFAFFTFFVIWCFGCFSFLKSFFFFV